MLSRAAGVVAVIGALTLLGGVIWLRVAPPASPTQTAPAPPSLTPSAAVIDRTAAPTSLRLPALTRADCSAGEAAATAANAATLETGSWSPSGSVETGWSTYAPLVARELGTSCPPQTPGFAAALARWQTSHALPVAGAMDAPTLKAIVVAWLLRRPFVQATRRGECPPAPDPSQLATALPGETAGGKPVQALPAALEAWRRMKTAARAEAPAIAADPSLLAIASGFRGPDEEAARCAEGGCDTVARARCSAHRTGTAFDLVLASGPGVNALSTAEADRKALVRTPAYLWLVANADRFGFLPYPYEPWHWEWAG